MDHVKIFLSHNSKYVDLATSLKNSLHALETKQSDAQGANQIDIKISEEMEGATNWRQWIEVELRSSDIFLLLFPDPNIDMSWCNYELGRFSNEKPIICIKNTNIPLPPPPFQTYQAYNGDQAGILKFINELFVKGTFTNKEPLNPKVGIETEDVYTKAQNVTQQLAKQFAKARLREQLYEWTIVLSIRYDAAKQFDPSASKVRGNANGMQLLGFGETQTVAWSEVRRAIADAEEWPLALERAIPSITAGSLPPTLPPFFASEVLYIPVITRAQSVDDALTELDLIFVKADTERLRRLLDWSLPGGMPDTMATLVRLIRMMFRARWDILEPAYQEAIQFRVPTAERCAEIVRAVAGDYDQMGRDALNQGIQGFDRFYGIFSRDLRPAVETCGQEWTRLMQELAAKPDETSEALAQRLKALRDNNATWLELAAKQFVLTVDDLH
jgi:hypothetical protein